MFSLIGRILFLVFAFTSLLEYFTSTKEAVRDEMEPMLAPFSDDLKESIIHNLASVYFTEKKLSTRLHMVVTCPIALGLLIQLTPAIRSKFPQVHRIVGRFTLLLSILMTPHWLLFIFNFKVSKGTQLLELPLALAIPYFSFNGYQQIKTGKVKQHRVSMIFLSACFFFFGVQRIIMVLWVLFHSSKAVAAFSPISKYTGDWDFDYWRNYYFTGCSLIGQIIVWYGAYRYAYSNNRTQTSI